MAGPETSRSPRLVWAALAGIGLFSLGLAVVCILQYRSCPFSSVPIIDEAGYISWARSILAGDYVGKQVFYQDPLYPYLLAFLFRLFGESYDLVRLCQAAMGAAAIGLVFLTARKLMGERTALAAAAILALYHGLYFFELQLVKATLIIFLSALSIYLGVLAAERPGARTRWLGAGASLGLLSLLRGNMLLLVPVLALWAMGAADGGWSLKGLLFPGPRRAGLVRAGLLLIGAGLMVGPVTVRNLAISGEFVLATSQGGPNFYIGNNEEARGDYTQLPFVIANPRFEAEDFQKEAEMRLGRALTRSEVSQFWFSEGRRWIREHPGAAARLWLRKAWLLVNEYEIPDNQSFALTRGDFVPALWVPFLGMGWLWGPALIGLLALVWQDRRALYPALFALAYAGSLVPFYILDRYRAPLFPALALFGAAFLEWAWRAVRGREYRRTAPAAAALAASLVIGLWPVHQTPPHLAALYGNLADSLFEKGRPDQALPWADRALDIMPDGTGFRGVWNDIIAALTVRDLPLLLRETERPANHPLDLYAVAMRLERLGRPGLAAAVYRQILAQAPDYFAARLRLFLIHATAPGLADAEKSWDELSRAREVRPDFKFTGEYGEALQALSDLLVREGDTVRAGQVERLRGP